MQVLKVLKDQPDQQVQQALQAMLVPQAHKELVRLALLALKEKLVL